MVAWHSLDQPRCAPSGRRPPGISAHLGASRRQRLNFVDGAGLEQLDLHLRGSRNSGGRGCSTVTAQQRRVPSAPDRRCPGSLAQSALRAALGPACVARMIVRNAASTRVQPECAVADRRVDHPLWDDGGGWSRRSLPRGRSRCSGAHRTDHLRLTRRLTNHSQRAGTSRYGPVRRGRSVSVNRHQPVRVDTGRHRSRSAFNPRVPGSIPGRPTHVDLH